MANPRILFQWRKNILFCVKADNFFGLNLSVLFEVLI